MLDKLSHIEKKYLDLREQSMNPEIISDQKKSIQINKELSSLQALYDLIQEYKKYESQMQWAKEIIADGSDPEMVEMAKEELKDAEQQLELLEQKIKIERFRFPMMGRYCKLTPHVMRKLTTE